MGRDRKYPTVTSVFGRAGRLATSEHGRYLERACLRVLLRHARVSRPARAEERGRPTLAARLKQSRRWGRVRLLLNAKPVTDGFTRQAARPAAPAGVRWRAARSCRPPLRPGRPGRLGQALGRARRSARRKGPRGPDEIPRPLRTGRGHQRPPHRRDRRHNRHHPDPPRPPAPGRRPVRAPLRPACAAPPLPQRAVLRPVRPQPGPSPPGRGLAHPGQPRAQRRRWRPAQLRPPRTHVPSLRRALAHRAPR